MPTEKLTTIYTQHTVYLQRLGATEGVKVLPYLELVESSVLSILNKYRKRKVTPALQVDIQRQISLATRKHLQDYTSQLKVENRALGAYEGEFAAATLNGIITADDFKAVAPVASAVNAIATITPVKIGTNSYSSYTSLMSNYWQKWESEMEGVVLDGFRSGSTIPEITNAITEQMDLSKSGTTKSTLDRARRSAKQLAITGTNHYANTARIAFVDTNSAILSGYRFLAVQDSRTSKQCASLDQRVFAKDDPKLSSATPPLHPNCRSALTYEVADKFKLDAADTRKASSFEVDGKRDPKTVTSDSIYYDNLKGLNKTDQDAVLGPTMGRAFRKMDNPAQFAKATVDENFNPLTIKQMREKNNVLGGILRGQKAIRKPRKPREPAKKVEPKIKINEIVDIEVKESIEELQKISVKKPKKPNVKIPKETKKIVKQPQKSKTTIKGKITGKESAYLDYYKSSGFYESNKVLRNPSKYSDMQVSSAKSSNKSINTAINKSSLNDDITLYRGVRSEDLFDSIGSDSVGASIPILTPQSFARDGRVSLTYAGVLRFNDDSYGTSTKGSVVMRLNAKKGQKALNMEELSDIGDTGESEMLISSNGTYRVTGVTERLDSNGKVAFKIIDIEYDEGEV